MLKRLHAVPGSRVGMRKRRQQISRQRRLEILSRLISSFVTQWELSLVGKDELSKCMVDDDFATRLDVYRIYLEKQTLGKLRELARGL